MKVLEQKSAEATTTDNQQSKLKFTTGADGSTNNLNWKLDICDGYSISLILGLSAQEYIFPRYCGFDARRFFLLEYQHAHFIYHANSREESVALVKTIMDIPRKNNTQLIINLLGCDKRGIYQDNRLAIIKKYVSHTSHIIDDECYKELKAEWSLNEQGTHKIVDLENVLEAHHAQIINKAREDPDVTF